MPDLKMPNINEVTLAGRLTRDPEMKYASTGVAICSFGVAVSRQYKTRDGEKKEEVYFGECEVFDKAAEYVGQYLHKGDPVYVTGSLKTDSWEDRQTGAKRSKTRIRARSVQGLAWPSDGQQSAPSQNYGEPARPSAPAQAEVPMPDDDLPF